ncbi:Ankyrin repeat domain-containing protein, partial [Tetrabaena socialis]
GHQSVRCSMELQRTHKRQRRSQPPASPPQQRQPAAATSDPSDIWHIWLPEIVQRFAVSLTSNEVACALRLVNKATAAQFSAAQHTTVRLSQPVPHHAFVRRWASPNAMRTLARQQRLELPCLTARSGSIANLEVLLARDDMPPVLDHNVFRAAAAAGQLDMCAWLRQQGCPWRVGLLAAAAGGGHRAVCEWLLANGCPDVGKYWGATVAAARGGHVDLMDWLLLRTDGTQEAGYDLMEGAAEGCDLPTLQRLHHTHADTRPGWEQGHYVITAAAGSPTADWQAKVERLEAWGHFQTGVACRAAAATPDALSRLQWLRQRSYQFDSWVAASAAGAGNVEALEYVLGQGVKEYAEQRGMMWRAARGGHVAVMEVLHARGVPISENAVCVAALNAHLPAVAWLVERLGAATALTTDVFEAAARAGSMELLAWLRARGCPWDATVFAAAAAEGSEEQLEWLAEQGCPMGDDGEPYACCAAAHEPGMLRCLRRLGCPWSPDGSTFARAVRHVRNRNMGQDVGQHVGRGLCWLLDQGCPVDWNELVAGTWPLRSMELQRTHKRQRRSQPPASPPQQRQPAAATSDPSDIWHIWLPEIVQRFAVSLTSNEVACALRLVNKATAAQFSAAQHTTVRLSQPVPHHAFVRRWASPNAMRTLARQQRLELPCLTARSGSIANLEVLLARDDMPPVLDHNVFRAAAAAGQLDMCAWLRQQGCPWRVGLLAAAAGGGHRAVCEWLLANGCPDVGKYWGATVAAARGGHVDLMDWLLLRTDGTQEAGYDLMEGAAEGCDLPTLQRLHHTHADTRPGWEQGHYVITAAAGSPTADWQAKVERLEAWGHFQTGVACRAAAATPDALSRLQWLRQRSYQFDSWVAASAAGAGNVEALEYVLGQGVKEYAEQRGMMWRAARGGHVAVMEVLHARGVPISENAVCVAALNAHLPAVAWLVERLGAATALTTDVFEAAARAGSMELLAWLRARGCPWDATVFAAAAAEGSEEQLEWLAEQGCPMGDDGEPYACCAAAHEPGMLRCLRRLGCPWSPDGSTFARAVRHVRNRNMGQDVGQHVGRGLCWLLDQGCPVDWNELVAGTWPLRRWLHVQRRQRGLVDT